MNLAAVTLFIFAFVLASFGVGFAGAGMSNERAYWSQRDPHGNAAADATRFAVILQNAFKYSAGEYRAPLRVAAIGVLMLYLAGVFAALGILVLVLSQ
ncbi:MAG: hypothetical protein Q8M73_08065 [Actinomycetota bacterium]|nr:hypothetical protein [Actinomycetota bacterium]